MELALSLGDPSKPFKFLHKTPMLTTKDLGFSMSLGAVGTTTDDGDDHQRRRVSSPLLDPPLQLDLLPLNPVPLTVVFEAGLNDGSGRGFDVNRLSCEEGDEGAALSSPNSAATSPFRMEFGIRGGGRGNKRDLEVVEAERAGSRASDDDENGTRKKLRLSKEQSAFLEESFKEHNTLNPKQKLALAKQLNLRPRQVEVWFQNRRARTKLKQTEVDCEYLKRCCETLTEENRRLQKELQELRALKTSQPFYMQLPATTLTMCPSCERVDTTSTPTSNTATAAAAAVNSTSTTATSTTLSLAKPRLYPFSQVQVPQAQAHQAAS